MPRPRLLVLGADGMLGQTVCRALSRSGSVEVLGTSRRGSEPWVPFDAETGDVGGLLRSVGSVDYVVNAIAVLARDLRTEADERRGRLVNGVFPHRLCQAAAGAGARVFLVSTDAVFGCDQGPCVESTTPDARGVYGASKLEGEVRADHVLNLRCSLVGPDARVARGLLEWLRGQPPGVVLRGFTDQRWSGITTLQFAGLCERVVTGDLFGQVRAESPVHHVCPNRSLTKFELLVRLRDCYRPDLVVAPEESGDPVSRELATELRSIPALLGTRLPMRRALQELREFGADRVCEGRTA